MKEARHVSWKNLIARLVLSIALSTLVAASASVAAQSGQRISLDGVVILVDKDEASYIQYAAKDLGNYIAEITGKPVPVSSSADPGRNAGPAIAVGEKMARAMGADLGSTEVLGDEDSVIRSFDRAGERIVVVAGLNPHGTNTGIATLLQMIRSEGKSPYLEGPLDLRNKPSVPVRGFHVNGWALNYPYTFRAWREEDWKRFVDISWAQRVNLLMIWPFMEIMPVPLSTEDEAYLQEVRRVVDYAHNQRGMKVWIMQSANRIATSDCGTRDPRLRPYWVNDCQKDMNPADPQQFANIVKSFDAFYQIVNNADGFCMIDSDPGGWPQSPLSDQSKIFNAARKLLDRHNIHGKKTKLVDWMWIGWGRHKFVVASKRLVTEFDWTETNPDEGDLAFMAETMLNFKNTLAEPWEMVAGMTPYLESSKRAGALSKTTYLPYGTLELEPSFPATTMGLDPVRKVLDKAAQYPELRSLMGNNQLMLLQFPRDYFFFASLWDTEYRKRSEREVLLDLSEQLYSDHKELITDSFLALREKDRDKIIIVVASLEKLIHEGSEGRSGAIGRYLFPNRLIVVKTLQAQLGIRLARQSLLKALEGNPDIDECAKLVEDYFDKLLAWNKETGWDKLIDSGIWTSPIYEQDRDFDLAMGRLKIVLGQGASSTRYAQVDAFVKLISKNLLKKYGQDSVMIGCIEPFKLAIIKVLPS